MLFKAQVLGPGCGNHTIEPGEDCDDGNDIDTDVCTNSCRSNIAYLHGMAEGEQRFFLLGSKEPPKDSWIDDGDARDACSARPVLPT